MFKMNLGASMEVSDDRRYFRLRSPGIDQPILNLDAASVDTLIKGLVEARKKMRPPRVDQDQPRATDSLIDGASRWHVGIDLRVDGIILSLRHPSLGWIGLPMSQKSVTELVAAIAALRPRPRSQAPNS